MSEHATALVARFGRTGYLHLKFTPGNALPPVLTSLGIPFDHTALDLFLRAADHGQPWDVIPHDPFGARASIRRGHNAQASELIRSHIRRIVDSGDIDEQLPVGGDLGQALSEMVYDALWLLEASHRDPAMHTEGVSILESVAALEDTRELSAHAIREARDVVARLRAELGEEPDLEAVAAWARRYARGTMTARDRL